MSAFHFCQCPPENLHKRGIQIRGSAVQVKNNDRIRQKVQKDPISPLSIAAGPVLKDCPLLRGFQSLPGHDAFGHIPGNPPESDFLTVLFNNQVGGDFKDARLPVLSDDLPYNIRDTLFSAIDIIETFIGNFGIFFVHEFTEIALLNLVFGTPENSAEGIVEKSEIPTQIGLIETICNIFNENPIAVFVYFVALLFQPDSEK